jgi:hypothetical protein
MSNSKDSTEVVKFLSLLAQLKDCCEDDPKGLSDLAKEDEGVKRLCNQLAMTASILRMNERRRRHLFAAPVDPKFLTAYRDFEERFEKPLGGIWLADILPGVDKIEPRRTCDGRMRITRARNSRVRSNMRSSLLTK